MITTEKPGDSKGSGTLGTQPANHVVSPASLKDTLISISPAITTAISMIILTLVIQTFFTGSDGKSIVDNTITVIGLEKIPLDLSHELARVSGRISWTIWSVVYALTLAYTFIISIQVVTRQLDFIKWPRVKKVVLGLVLAIAVTGTIIYINPGLHMLAIAPFTRIIDNQETSDIGSWLEVFKTASYFISGLLVVVGTFVLSAAIQGANPSEPGTDDDKVKQLSGKQQDLRELLFSGAILLTVGVIHIQTIYAWTHAFFPGTGDALKPVVAFSSTLVVYVGLSASLVLAAAYLPSVLALTHLANKLTEDQKLLKEYELTTSTQGFLTRTATILLPLLTAPLAGIIKQIFGAS